MTGTLGIGSKPSDSGTFARLVDVTVCQPSITEVELRMGRFRRPLRMEVRVTPWRRGRALVELVPCERRVSLTRAYFAGGHRLLDHVIDELIVRDRAIRTDDWLNATAFNATPTTQACQPENRVASGGGIRLTSDC